MRLRIPQYARNAARKALRKRAGLSQKDRFGLNASQARTQGIRSGVSQAKRIIKGGTLSVREASPYAQFYQRFKNCKTPRCEGALNLWGGRRFGRVAQGFVRLAKSIQKFK